MKYTENITKMNHFQSEYTVRYTDDRRKHPQSLSVFSDVIRDIAKPSVTPDCLTEVDVPSSVGGLLLQPVNRGAGELLGLRKFIFNLLCTS